MYYNLASLSFIQIILLYFSVYEYSCCLSAENYGSSIQDPQLCPHNSGLIAVISSLAYLLQIQSKKGKLPLKDSDGKQKRSLTPEVKYNFCLFCVYLMVHIDSWN